MLRRIGLLFYRLADLVWFITSDWDWERHYIITGEKKKKNMCTAVGERFALLLQDAGDYLRRPKQS